MAPSEAGLAEKTSPNHERIELRPGVLPRAKDSRTGMSAAEGLQI